MSDILGPANAVNAVTVRPAENRSFGSLDSWFKDCSDPTTDDGTDVTSAWLNGIVAALRGVWRRNGMRADGTTPVNPEVGTDDLGVAKAIDQMIQRGQQLYGEDTGTTNLVAVAFTPAIIEYKKGLAIRVKMANPPLGLASINCNALGAKEIKKGGGQGLTGGEWSAGDIVSLVYDGAYFQITSVRGPVYLIAARDYYVNTATGNDANDGLTAGTPYKTINRAVNVECPKFNLNGFTITIHVAPGSYVENVICPNVGGSGSIIIQGNDAAANTIISPASGSAVFVMGAGYVISGFKCNAPTLSGGDPGSGILVQRGGSITVKTMWFGACRSAHMEASGNIFISGPIHVQGGAFSHCLAELAGLIACDTQTPPVYTIDNAVTFTIGWVSTIELGIFYGFYGSVSGFGNAGGPKFTSDLNGVIWTNGAGVNYFPGSAPGTTSTGGQYY